MGKTCCASNCTNRFQKGNGLSFHRFALTGDRGERWLQALQRDNFIPNEYTWICSAHFQTGKPSTDENHPDYVPNIFSCSAPQSKQKKSSEARKRLTSDYTVPNIFTCLTPQSSQKQKSSEERKQRMTTKKKTKEKICTSTEETIEVHADQVESLITKVLASNAAREGTCGTPGRRLHLQDVIDIVDSNPEDTDSCEEICQAQAGALQDIVEPVYDTKCSTCELLMTENLNLVLENSSLRQTIQELKEEITDYRKCEYVV